MNSGVCIKGTSNSAIELDYYGRLQEILELEFPALPIKRTVLFKCSWFDPTLDRGTRIHPQYKIVEVKRGRVFNKYEPFILAVQASQVFFATYPTLKRNMNEWLVVCKIKARSIVEVSNLNTCLHSDEIALQEDVSEQHGIDSVFDDLHPSLNDVNGSFVDMDDDEINTNVELHLKIEDDEEEEEEDNDDEDGEENEDDNDDDETEHNEIDDDVIDDDYYD